MAKPCCFCLRLQKIPHTLSSLFFVLIEPFMRSFFLRPAITAAVFLSISISLKGQAENATPPADWFPFTIPALDDAPSAIDLSFLNEAPAGKDGFISVKGENLVDGKGKTWRYFGFNLVASACFPDQETAKELAAHLAKSGVNLIRFHFLDENWSEWQLVRKDNQPGFNEEALARFDFLFAELKKQGIYSNINLHVGRQYPDQPKDAPRMSKGIDNIYPPYVDALKNYARELLTHVNPHTGIAYQNDPAVALVEVNNENTLMMNSFWPAKMSGSVRESIQAQWNDWIGKNYTDKDEEWRQKWGTQQTSGGEDLLINGSFTNQASGWFLLNFEGAESSLVPAEQGNGIRLNTTKAGAENWHTQFSTTVPMERGKAYRFTFRARASGDLSAYLTVQQAESPWGVVANTGEVSLSSEWKDYAVVLTANDMELGKTNLVIGTNAHVGWFEFADAKLENWSDGYLPIDATVTAGAPIPDASANKAVLRDWYRFLAEVELSYTQEMHRFLKEDLHIKCPVSHSHIFFGSLFGVRREALGSDVVNANCYWHHPRFTKGMWDPEHWEIKQEVLSQDPVGGVLSELAVQRAVGKPFAITEWDIPAPIESTAEGLPLMAAFASYQGWAGITAFAFAHTQEDYQSDRFHSFFNYQGHPAKRAGLPLAALLFRQELVAQGESKERAVLSISMEKLFDDIVENNGNIWSSWRRFYEPLGNDGSLALKKSTGIEILEKSGKPPALVHAVAPSEPAVTDNGQIRWGAQDKVAVVHAPQVLFASGSLAGKPLQLGKVTFEAAAWEGDPFAVWGLIALDGNPVEESKKLLGVALKRAENPGMIWKKDRLSVGKDWGTGPALVAGYTATVKLPGTGWKVTSLNPLGQPVAILQENSTEWIISPEAKTVWWLLER